MPTNLDVGWLSCSVHALSCDGSGAPVSSTARTYCSLTVTLPVTGASAANAAEEHSARAKTLAKADFLLSMEISGLGLWGIARRLRMPRRRTQPTISTGLRCCRKRQRLSFDCVTNTTAKVARDCGAGRMRFALQQLPQRAGAVYNSAPGCLCNLHCLRG